MNVPDFYQSVRFVTDFGDAAILLPISLAVFICLVIGRAYRVAGAWALSIVVCIIAMVALKLLFRTCGGVWTDDAIISPSGHTAFSTTVYGGLACLLAIRTPRPWLRVLFAALAAIWIVCIGVSRVWLNAHTPDEVLIGWAIGASLVALLCSLTWRTPVRCGPLVMIAVLVTVLLFLLHGQHSNIESFLISIVLLIHQTVSVCSY